jgi:hypothetical protein
MKLPVVALRGEMGAFPATGGALTLGEITHSRKPV